MLPRENRLKKKKDFERVFKEGKFLKNNSFILGFVKNELENVSRFGIIVSSKVSKKSVIRNKIKRRIRAIIRDLLLKTTPGIDAVLIALPLTVQHNFYELKEQLIALFEKAKILK